MPRIEPEAIAAALRAAETGPAPADLADAPELGAWSVVTYPGEGNIRLAGRVRGHPVIEGPTVTTSPLLVLDEGDGRAGWARTLSRWYRVDVADFRPADPETRADEWAAIQRVLAGYRRALAEIVPALH